MVASGRTGRQFIISITATTFFGQRMKVMISIQARQDCQYKTPSYLLKILKCFLLLEFFLTALWAIWVFTVIVGLPLHVVTPLGTTCFSAVQI
jgi:hypothetical protein